MIRYNNILEKLKNIGYNTNKLREETELSESAIQAIRHDKPIQLKSIDIICGLLECQPGDLLTWYDDDGGYFLPEDYNIEYLREDIGHAKDDIELVVNQLSEVCAIKEAWNKSPEELQDILDSIADRANRALISLKSAERYLGKIEKNQPKKLFSGNRTTT